MNNTLTVLENRPGRRWNKDSFHVKSSNNKTCTLIKKFKNYPDKIVYQGTLRGAKKRIPPSKKDQYEIQFKR